MLPPSRVNDVNGRSMDFRFAGSRFLPRQARGDSEVAGDRPLSRHSAASRKQAVWAVRRACDRDLREQPFASARWRQGHERCGQSPSLPEGRRHEGQYQGCAARRPGVGRRAEARPPRVGAPTADPLARWRGCFLCRETARASRPRVPRCRRAGSSAKAGGSVSRQLWGLSLHQPGSCVELGGLRRLAD